MRPSFEIVVTNAGAELSRYTVTPGEYTIGRSSTSSILIKVGPVSRQHARMVVEESGAVAVEDLASANGTQLGEQVIAGLTAWPPGKLLQIGDVTLHLLAIPPERPTDEYAPTLSPSQAGDYEAAPATPPSERRTVSGEAATIIRRHLPLVTREAQQLDREKEIARGGMGAVLQARESATRRTVAMKIMLRGEDAKGTLRFIEEAQVTAQLEHPNIVPVHELGIDGSGQVFYTMKLVQGITLKKIIELLHKKTPGTVAKYSLPTLLTIFQKAADAVAFAHSKGAIHRDLKPANIMVGSFGEVLVMDWGLAKLVPPGAAPPEPKPPMPPGANAPRPAGAVMTSARGDEGEIYATMDGAVMGTPHYMAPEQARGEIDKLDERTDIFALGAILYHLLTLQLPFGGTTVREIITRIVAGEPPATPLSFNKSAGAAALPHCPGGLIPDSLSAVCMKALAHNPLQRYATVKALQADILSYQNGFATSAEQASLARQLKLFLRRHRAVVTAAGTALLLAAVGIGGWQVWRYRLKVGEHDRLVESAERASKNGDWDTSVSALGRAIIIHDVKLTREKLRASLLTGAKDDLKRERYGAAAIKLQEMLRLAPADRDAHELMPYALGEGFVSVEAKFPAELVEIVLDENLRPSSGANSVRRVGALPVKELRLRQGFHHFEIHRDGQRWCSLPVEVKRAGRARVVIPISEIPAGYEYVHEGDYIQGDEGTTQADGFLGKRTRRTGGFFIRATLVAGEEYFRFREAANFAELVNKALAADGLTAADIQAGAKGPGDLQAFHENIPNAELVAVRALSYYEAAAFAKWADARLPTEEEWEKAARGIDGRTFSIGLLPPGQIENHMLKPPTRESADVSPFGCYGLTQSLWQWTSSRSESDSNRYVVKGGAGRVSIDMKPARRKPMDPKTKYHSVGVLFCKDLGEAK